MGIRILITGDFCPIGRNLQTITENNFEKLLGGFEKFSQTADLAITNLECPITESNNPIKKAGPNLKSDASSLKILKSAHFDLVTLANNHIMDYGPQGLASTIDALDRANIEFTGAGRNLSEARKIFYKKIKEKNIAIVNVAENEFCAADKSEPGANPVNLIDNHKDIKEAKENADFVIVIAHGGKEHYPLPTPKVKERYRFYVDSGADLVVAHHTHIYSGFEIYNEKPIFYSLGNFIFDYKKKYQTGNWTQGYGVMFYLNNNALSFDLIPFYQGRSENPDLKLFNMEEKNDFDVKVQELNKIITNDELFDISWKKYINEAQTRYKALLFTQNKYIRELEARSLIPKVFKHNKEHQLVLLNLLRCETHREIMIDVLKTKL